MFKLLGVHVDNKLKWGCHIDYICAKASSRLYCLKQFKKCSTSIDDMLHFYITIIRPVLEYACPVWHSSLTKEQSNRIESIQKRVIFILCGPGVNYDEQCVQFKLCSLYERRCELCMRFFTLKVLPDTSCLHYLLPERRDANVIDRLRMAKSFYSRRVHTNRFRNSFINYA